MGAQPLRLFPSPDSVDLELSREPGAKVVGLQPTTLSPADPLESLLDDFAASRSPDDVVALSRADAESAARLTLQQFYAKHFAPRQAARVEAKSIGKRGAALIGKHIKAFGDWDSHPERRIPGWPADRPWDGLPLRGLTGDWIKAFLADKIRGWPTGGRRWKEKTADSCRRSLATVLKFAADVGAIGKSPVVSRWRKVVRDVLDEDDDPEIMAYTDAELGAIYAALPDVVADAVRDGLKPFSQRGPREPEKRQQWRAIPRAESAKRYSQAMLRELQTAVVLAAGCGARPADLMSMQFRPRTLRLEADPPELVFRAAKTEKWHRIPLGRPVVAHIEQLRRATGRFNFADAYLFPHLADPDPERLFSRDPLERGPYKSHTLPVFLRALDAAGLEPSAWRNPIHSLRKSFVTRFNAHGRSQGLGPVGEWMSHGKSADVASQSYDDKWPVLCQAVESISWPAEFSQG